MNQNLGRKLRRLAEREARRKDGKHRDSFSEQRGKAVAVYKSGRLRQVER